MEEESVQLSQCDYAEASGLAKAFEVLSQVTEERLLSLTYKMGDTCAEGMVHAMCLIHLKRNEDAHAKLLTNGVCEVGNFLAEMIKVHGERLNGSHIGEFKISEHDVATLLDIARVFAVLVREQLCDAVLRDQAYRTVLTKSKRADLRFGDVENILEEIKNVCGFQACDEFPSSENGGLRSLDVSNVSHPSLPQSSSVCSSHTLEISSPSITESSMEKANLSTLQIHQTSKTTTCCDQTLPDKTTSITQTTAQTPYVQSSESCPFQTSKSTNPANLNTNKPLPPTNLVPPAVSEIEDTFYSFVILHEQKDADEAERLRNRIERIISGVGATFSEFEEPGRSTLCCMEDAINNSAFTLLLLTQNFNTNLSETSTNTAIYNSLEKHHKRHSVIPLLPLRNFLPRDRRRMVLRGTVPLDEGSRTFERAAFNAMSPAKVASQKRVWITEQRIRKANEERKRLQEERSRNIDLRRETERLARLRIESDTSYAQFGPAPVYNTDQRTMPMPTHTDAKHDTWQQPSCIHIENAQNVMIGNNSTMNIDHVQNSSEDD